MPGRSGSPTVGQLGVAGQEPVDEGAVGRAGPGMHHEPGRLVDHDDLTVGVDDRHLNARIGRGHAGPNPTRVVELDHLALAHPLLAGGHHLPVEPHRAELQQPRRRRPG